MGAFSNGRFCRSNKHCSRQQPRFLFGTSNVLLFWSSESSDDSTMSMASMLFSEAKDNQQSRVCVSVSYHHLATRRFSFQRCIVPKSTGFGTTTVPSSQLAPCKNSTFSESDPDWSVTLLKVLIGTLIKCRLNARTKDSFQEERRPFTEGKTPNGMGTWEQQTYCAK